VHPKASWAGSICCTHQHYRQRWLPNTRVVKFQRIRDWSSDIQYEWKT